MNEIMKKIKTIFNSSNVKMWDPTDSLDNFIKYFESFKETVPLEYRDKLQIDLSGGYDQICCGFLHCEIWYCEDEGEEAVKI